MQELIVTTQTPLVINGNFDALKAEMIEGLKAYEIEVTEENIKEAKKMATELNKLSTSIKKTKTDKAKEFGAPIEQFRKQAEELEALAQASREKILAQVKVFEDKTREECQALMISLLATEYTRLEVREEYRNDYEKAQGMAGISLIQNGKLTKAARESIESLAQQGRIAQDRVDTRLAKLEAESLKAGLETPLQREHVERWLTEADAVYSDNLERLIKIEVDRQAKAKAAIIAREQERIRAEEKAKAEAEAKEKARLEREALEKKEAEERQAQLKKNPPTTPTPAPSPSPIPESDKESIPETSDRVPFVVQMSFEVMAKPDCDTHKIVTWFESKIAGAGLGKEYKGITVFPRAALEE